MPALQHGLFVAIGGEQLGGAGLQRSGLEVRVDQDALGRLGGDARAC